MKNLLLVITFVVVQSCTIEAHASEALPFLSIGKCDNCSVAQFDKIKASAAKVNEVVSSQCFKDSLSRMPLIQTNGKTPAEVVEFLIHAGVKVDTKMYFTYKRVLGYTLPSVQKIWINSRYALKWDVCDMASLLVHEGLHKAGFKHGYQNTPTRKYSVPYSANRAMDACCTK